MRFTFLIVVLVSFNALLHSQEMLYYAEDTFGGSNIYRVNMDGTGKEVVGNTMLPCTAIVADYNRGKLFFSQQDFLTRCNLDGSDPQRVAFNFTHLIYDIKMDFSRNKLYVLTIKQGSSGSLKAVFQIEYRNHPGHKSTI
ncbi:MAG: hypothetical protein CR997_14080 [Acidobacteria bacterium]|nr:MAG: hypothetical protein CR997_14080 [Acidobacteriota bacterium]